MAKAHNIAVDFGNGIAIGATFKTKKGKITYERFSSVFAPTVGANTGMGNELNWYSYNGDKRYLVGDDVALAASRTEILSPYSTKKYDDFQHFMLGILLDKLGVPSGADIRLATALPPSECVTVKHTMPPAVYHMKSIGHVGNDHSNDLRPILVQSRNGSAKCYEIPYHSVTVFAEAQAALIALLHTNDGSEKPPKQLDGYPFYILDIGMHTTDVVEVVDNHLITEKYGQLGSTTGLQGTVFNKVKADLKREVDMDVDWRAIERAYRRGLETTEFVLPYAGKYFDISDFLDEAFRDLITWVDREIIRGQLDMDSHKLVLVGGGTDIIYNELVRLYGSDRILHPNQLSNTKDVHPVDMNVTGLIRYLKQG